MVAFMSRTMVGLRLPGPLRFVLLAGAFLVAMPSSGQSPVSVGRMADGRPDLNGIWQTLSIANWNLQDHAAYAGPVWELGAIAAVPAGQGVVEGNEIPYLPDAAAEKEENFANRRTEDPEAKCYMPGIPRANYMPYPFQIVQTPTDILMVYEYATANRLINMGEPKDVLTDTWMGTNNGHWDGDTLVVDVQGLNGLAWFDRAGNFASDGLHVVERFTRTGRDHIRYEATIEDPAVFSRPWTISLLLYRRVEENAQMLEFKCIEFAEQLLYGKFFRDASN
jgi:hypothetical protein